jgi:serine/threonine protein kinase
MRVIRAGKALVSLLSLSVRHHKYLQVSVGTLIALMGGDMPGQADFETILRTGQIVGGQYRVERLIAKGGMAAVWAGVNEHTGKRIALKVILRSFASHGEAAELFRREALAASKINHPNVVNIFDVIDHQGMACIVMELLDGETLGSYLARNGPLSLETTAALLLPAMRGVAAAHAQGVVHRDLKPGNIFLCNDSDGRLLTTKVLDFGISVMMRQAGDISTTTEPLAMFGTPAYMAPEAIELSPSIDGRADVYGFGVLFFEALTGKLPFPGPPGPELLKHVLTDPPPKVTLYRPDLSSDVAEIIDCALAKNANDRFPDMEHFIHAAEERLLTLPAPRALTPSSGLFPIPRAESTSGTTVPLVHAVNDNAPPSGARLDETRALYSLASEPPGAADRAAIVRRTRPSPRKTAALARQQRGFLANHLHLFKRRAAISAAILAFLIALGWVSVPASSNDSGAGEGRGPKSSEAAAEAPRPPVMTPPSIPAPPPSLASTADDPGAVEPMTRVSPPHPSKPVSGGQFTARQSREADIPRQLSAPRAGRLYSSDF